MDLISEIGSSVSYIILILAVILFQDSKLLFVLVISRGAELFSFVKFGWGNEKNLSKIMSKCYLAVLGSQITFIQEQ